MSKIRIDQEDVIMVNNEIHHTFSMVNGNKSVRAIPPYLHSPSLTPYIVHSRKKFHFANNASEGCKQPFNQNTLH